MNAKELSVGTCNIMAQTQSRTMRSVGRESQIIIMSESEGLKGVRNDQD